MGRIASVLQASTKPSVPQTPTTAPRSRIGQALAQFARGVSQVTTGFWPRLDRGVKSEIVRLGKQASEVPTFQKYAPALGEIARAPLKTLKIPTEVTAGVGLGTPINPVVRALERQGQDTTLAAVGDLAGYDVVRGTASMGLRGLSRIGQVLRGVPRIPVARRLPSPSILNAKFKVRPLASPDASVPGVRPLIRPSPVVRPPVVRPGPVVPAPLAPVPVVEP